MPADQFRTVDRIKRRLLLLVVQGADELLGTCGDLVRYAGGLVSMSPTSEGRDEQDGANGKGKLRPHDVSPLRASPRGFLNL